MKENNIRRKKVMKDRRTYGKYGLRFENILIEKKENTS